MTAFKGWTVAVGDVPDGGKRFTRTASDAERQALARDLDILAITKLDCEVRVKPIRGGRYHVIGTVRAEVEQACVVSLEPVAGIVSEAIDVEFWPREQIAKPTSTAEDEWLDPQADDQSGCAGQFQAGEQREAVERDADGAVDAGDRLFLLLQLHGGRHGAHGGQHDADDDGGDEHGTPRCCGNGPSTGPGKPQSGSGRRSWQLCERMAISICRGENARSSANPYR